MHQLIDSHCHWDDSRLQALQPHLWQSCISQGVQQLVVPGTQWAFFARQIGICEQNPLWHLALGLHPYFSDQHSSQHVLDLAKAIVDYKPVAVGEIGLDFALDTPKETMEKSILSNEIVLKWMDNKPLKKLIIVPGKIINVVV